MKGKYTKPVFHMEHFSLSQTIADSCGWTQGSTYGRPTHAEKGQCGWFDGVDTVYWTDTVSCDDAYSGDLVIGEVCYNAPNGMPQIFAS